MIRLLAHQTRYDLLTFLRNRQARFFTVALPVIFLVIFVGVFGNQLVGPQRIKASTYYVPGIAALGVLTASFSSLVIAIATQRELGVLKRRRATPVPASVLVGGRALTSLVVSAIVTAVVIAIGNLGYGVHLAPAAVGALAVSVVVGSLAFACLGYAVSTAIGSTESAQPTVLALTLPLSFVSGIYIPSLQLPATLRQVAEVFPLQHLVAAIDHGFLPGGTGIAWGDLAIVVAWGAIGLVFALRRFRWSPAATAA